MLTPRQEKFCIEYAASGNAYKSAIAAGYSDAYAKGNVGKLLENVRVKTRLQELKEKAESEKIADVKEMQEKLTEIIRQSLDEEVIVIEGVGDGCSEARTMTKKPSTKDVISAITTLGKMQGAFVEKVEQQVDMELNIKIDYGDEDDEEKT